MARPAINAICSSMPRKPAAPPKPEPISMPKRPPRKRPPRRPPARPPKSPRLCGAACPAAFGVAALRCVPGVMVRSTGAAGFGAVRVTAGVLKVRLPRLPKPPPRRASAKSTAAKEKAIARAAMANTLLKRRMDENILISSRSASARIGRHIAIVALLFKSVSATGAEVTGPFVVFLGSSAACHSPK